MSDYLGTLICLFIFMLTSALTTITYIYEEEQAMVRSVHEQIVREMAGDGYLDNAIASYYEQALKREGFETSSGSFFHASHVNPGNRAVKPQYGQVNPAQNFVELETRVRPSFSTTMIQWIQTGSGDIVFRNMRESQYIPD